MVSFRLHQAEPDLDEMILPSEHQWHSVKARTLTKQ